MLAARLEKSRFDEKNRKKGSCRKFTFCLCVSGLCSEVKYKKMSAPLTLFTGRAEPKQDGELDG